MENKKSNTGLIVAIVVLVMLLLFGGTLLLLSSMGYLNFDKNEVKEEEKINDNNISSEINNSLEKYSYIIDDYKKYINNLDYESENINYSDLYIISNSDFIIGYTYYDLDNNGISELLISRIDNNGKFLNIIDVYTSNQNNVVKVLDRSDICQRCGIEIWDNGMIFYRGSGGAARGYLYFYKVSSNNSEYVDRYMYEYEDEFDYSIYKIDSNGIKIGNKLDYSSDNELISKYKNDASSLSLDGVKWIVIR